MSVTVTNIGTSMLLIPDTNELEVLGPPPIGITHRTITRIRFQNFDSSSHTPTISIRESDLSKINDGEPELRRLYIPRTIVASGEQDDCSPIFVLLPSQSLVVELAADPSDTSDDQTWPSITVHWIDQFILQSTPFTEEPSRTEVIERTLAEFAARVP